jgi:hypothetical protein
MYCSFVAAATHHHDHTAQWSIFGETVVSWYPLILGNKESIVKQIDTQDERETSRQEIGGRWEASQRTQPTQKMDSTKLVQHVPGDGVPPVELALLRAAKHKIE